MRKIISFLLLIHVINCHVINKKAEECNLPAALQEEIASYAPIANQIIDALVYGEHKGSTYNKLADFVDKFGSRLPGSTNLENSIDYMIEQSIASELENVHGEELDIMHWERGSESAVLLEPRVQQLTILGLGGSVGTPSQGIRAEAIVVTSFEELSNVSTQVRGKIVVYNQEYLGYSASAQYRGKGASEAAKYGAVAALIRSITPFSLSTPHTGVQQYAENVTQIPAVSITVEDANMLHRMYKRGDKLTIELKMEAKILADTKSRNTVAEIVGTSQPEKVVVVSGHIDSWDVGQGVMDDAGGVFMSWNSLVVLKSLGLRPRRTIRAILWTAEEIGLVGAYAYYAAHQNETENLNFVMESDAGTFNASGLRYNGVPEAGCILQEVMNLLAPINTTKTMLVAPNGVSSDISIWTERGVPGAELLFDVSDNYFWYHHSAGDTMDVENPEVLDKITAMWATVAYVLADLSVDMPKNTTMV